MGDRDCTYYKFGLLYPPRSIQFRSVVTRTVAVSHQENTMALGASFYLLDTLEAPFYSFETPQVCFKCVKKVKRSPRSLEHSCVFLMRAMSRLTKKL